MRKALLQVEARRIELERAIIMDMEERFFADPEPDTRDEVTYLGLMATSCAVGTCTGSVTPFSTVWFAQCPVS
jgi:hypothetical protein